MKAEQARAASHHCDLCGRQVHQLTRHHLIPQTRHKNKRNKRHFDRREVKERVAWLCRPCHKNIHACIDNKVLEYEYNTLMELARHPSIAKFTAWIKNKPEGTAVRVRRSKSYHA